MGWFGQPLARIRNVVVDVRFALHVRDATLMYGSHFCCLVSNTSCSWQKLNKILRYSAWKLRVKETTYEPVIEADMFPTGMTLTTKCKIWKLDCSHAFYVTNDWINNSIGDTYTRPASTSAIRINSLAESPLIAARIAFSAHQNNSRWLLQNFVC